MKNYNIYNAAMDGIVFDGQQSGERILAEIQPHPYTLSLTILKIILVLIFFYIVLVAIASLIPSSISTIRVISTLFFIFSLAITISWTLYSHNRSKTYLTDRRIMRFELQSPVYRSKRALFWNEALKAKAYQTNVFWRMLKIGTIQVEPEALVGESIWVPSVYLYEDVANYIDKIIYTVKNKPGDMVQLKPFKAKPRGQRG